MRSHVRDHLNAAFSPRRQRVVIVFVGIFLQILFFVALFYGFQHSMTWLYWVGVGLSVGVSLYISTQTRRLAYQMAWIIPILLFPLVGGVLFLLLGGARKPGGYRGPEEQSLLDQLSSPLSPQDRLCFGSDPHQLLHYLEQAAGCPGYRGTETRYFPSGEAFLPAFLEELDRATRSIYLEYFIIAEGELWQKILDILTTKAARGVDVRILYDGLGSAATLPSDYPDQMESRGIRCQVFRPFRPVLSIHQNNRDHRKLCVIDGTTGFVGGLNLADEYVGLLKRFGVWKDSALLLRGDACRSLTVFFQVQWTSITGESFAPLPPLLPDGWHTHQGGLVVPYADTPQPGSTTCVNLLLLMISRARIYCYLTTPYLIIDETMTAALSIAAQTGVDVRVMTPHIPDKKAVFAVTRSNYLPLLNAGVKIYEFTPGFCHSKLVVADDLYASVGSCNLDYRSLYLQFENGVWLCGSDSVLEIRDDFLQTLPFCQEIRREDCENTPLPKRLLTSLYRLFSPLF